MKNLFTAVDTIRKNYDTSISIVPGLSFRQKDIIRLTEFYSNSKYLNGQYDELGREKPFYQILNAICDVEDAAKDIDTKDIAVTSDDGNHYTQSQILAKDIYEWMKETNFAKTLNDMKRTHTRYGSLLVKKVRKDGQLRIDIPEWKNVITDQVDILNNPIIEIHYLTPSQLLEMTEWKNTQELAEKALKSGYNTRIPVYEIRGKFPLAYYKEMVGEKVSEKDKRKFTYQLYYLAGEPIEKQESEAAEGKYTYLYCENDTEEVYKYLARKKKAGRAFGVGVFEEGEQAQIWTNDTVLKQHRAMELTTKAISQSASRKLKGRNLLNETDDGVILEIEDGKPINPVNLVPSGGLQQFNNLINQWYDQLQKVTSAYPAQRGETPPSGTPFRLQAILLNQTSSVFNDLREDLGIFITEIFQDWILPELMQKLNKKHILAHDFSPEELKEIDKNFAQFNANQKAKEMLLSGKIVTQEEYDALVEGFSQQVKLTKNKRFLDIPKDYYKNVKAKITVNVTGEQFNKAAVLESLANILQVYAANPNLASNPVLSQILMRIVELSGAGISPVSLMAAIEEAKKEAIPQGVPPQTSQSNLPTPTKQLPELSLQANPLSGVQL
jgi:hypothetical protein